MVPDILPPPITILQLPPAGLPTSVFVLLSQIEAVLVVLFAISFTFTVKVTFVESAGQDPFDAILYLIVTSVLEDTFAGV